MKLLRAGVEEFDKPKDEFSMIFYYWTTLSSFTRAPIFILALALGSYLKQTLVFGSDVDINMEA